MQGTPENMFADSGRKDNAVIIERIVSRIVAYWPVILICVVVSFICSVVYLRYKTPIYAVHAKVLLRSDSKKSADGGMLAELGLENSANNVESEVEIFKSRLLMQRVVEYLHLNIQYYVPGKIQTGNLYNDAPFRIVPLFNDSTIQSDYSYHCSLTDDKKFEITSGNNKWNGALGDTVNLTAGRAVIAVNPLAGHMYDATREFIFTISPIEPIADMYAGALTIELPNKQVSVITLSIQDAIPQRGEDILSCLIEEYKYANVEDKNQVADGTIDFIDNRLADVEKGLTGVEKDFASFKSANRITNVATNAELLSTNTNDNIKELTQKEIQLKVLESLEKYLNDNNNVRRIMPATLIAQDLTLVKIIEDYNTLQTNRQRLLLSYTENSIYIKNIDKQLEDLRGSMKNYIVSLKAGYEVSVNELKAQEGLINAKVGQVPEKERVFLDYERKQQIKQDLYLFLLKKREEMAISKTANVSNLKVIDVAKRDSSPVTPKKSRVYLIALVIGLAVPGLRITSKEVFGNKVSSRADVEKLTQVPVIAEIAKSRANDMIVVKSGSKSIIAEQFRGLRTNLHFLLSDEQKKVIMVTSSMSGEGKSFVTLNLAGTIALSGKKVVVVELDLRKPKIAKYLGINNDRGFSDYIIEKADLNSIIKPSGIQDNLYVITSGTTPPNPAELLMLTKVETFFNELKTRFDYILIDTAPVGLVTDAQLLNKYADASLYVLRQDYTYKQQVMTANTMYQAGKLHGMGFVINDVKKSSDNYGYGNYNSGYFEDERSSVYSKFKHLIKRK
ncbi:MAG: polysaccharide biosynthesis tyrosine autokinase [Bacteroidetes bacterium]|nr:polysaccharide biosynthesis tyrosine autokinase [Bacteroidota bacterium]